LMYLGGYGDIWVLVSKDLRPNSASQNSIIPFFDFPFFYILSSTALDWLKFLQTWSLKVKGDNQDLVKALVIDLGH